MVHFARAAVLQGFAETAAGAGVDPAGLCEAAGVPSAALSNPDMRIRCDAFGALLDLAARHTRIEDFSLRMARIRRASTWGVTGLLMSLQQTLGQALRAGKRYISGQSQEVAFQIEPLGDETAMWIDVDQAGYAIRFDPTQRNELLLGGATYIIRNVLDRPEWRPLAVGCTHAARGDLERYRPYFDCIPSFDQERLHLLIKTADLALPLPRYDAEAARLMRLVAEERLPEPERPFSQAVALLISQHLADGALSAASVAATLGLDLRSLQRRLAAEGTSFTELLNGVRLNLTRTFVDSSRRPLAEVADLLGFSSLSAFSQWYSRTRGHSAAERRGVRH